MYIKLCIGGGIDSLQAGACGPTRTFGIGFFNASSTILVTQFPDSLTSDSTEVTYSVLLFGPGFQGSDEFIAYLDNGTDFTCIHSTSICGRPHIDCQQLHFVINNIPDSVRAYGLEGAGSALGGCYPNVSTVIDFSTLPVEWAGFDGSVTEGATDLYWRTAKEVNSDYFEIRRSEDGVHFEIIGRVPASGTTDQPQAYSFKDNSPFHGSNFYQLVEVDQNGNRSQSEILHLEYHGSSRLHLISISPVPVNAHTRIKYFCGHSNPCRLAVYEPGGKLVLEHEINSKSGSNSYLMNMQSLPPGLYFIKLNDGITFVSRKIIKL